MQVVTKLRMSFGARVAYLDAGGHAMAAAYKITSSSLERL